MKRHRLRLANFESAVRADLMARRWMRWHSFLLGTSCFLASWAVSAGLMRAGIETLALRWPLALVAAYSVFIGLLWLWCRWLLSRDEADADPGLLDGIDLNFSGGGTSFRSGGGGDFGGGGASGSFGGESVVESAGEATQAAFEAATSSDEGIVIAVPLAVVVGVAVLISSALAVAVFGLFGVDVLLGAAVDIAFASAGGALAFRAHREGWLAHALSRTGRSAVALLLIVCVLGAVIDHWLPQANSLPQAMRLLLH